jgi:hypothetical protein
MEEIIFNYNICDSAPECGGISCCTKDAIIYKDGKPQWVRNKCDFCLECTTREACPVGAILYARNEKESSRIKELISQSPITNEVLWSERYGVQPASYKPIAKIITKENLISFITDNSFKVVDIWHPDALDCRLKSALYTDLFTNLPDKTSYYKYEGGTNHEIDKHIVIKKYPTIIIYKNSVEIYRHEGLVSRKNVPTIQTEIQTALNKHNRNK